MKIVTFRQNIEIALPRRIRLLNACRDHLYNRVKVTLATDKEIRTIRDLDKRVSDYYVRQIERKE